jgi:alpha-ketoglutarate-dependent taurine dioxygenase
VPGTITRLVTRGRAIPWLALYESGKWIYGHGKRAWENLDPPERERLGGLLRKSKGRRSNLSARERDELRSLVRKSVTGKG